MAAEKRSSRPVAARQGHRRGADPRPLGGRRPPADPRQGGGGYLGSRTAPNVVALVSPAFDERRATMDELRAMGMLAVWLDVAEIVGPAAFLRVWERLDREYGFQEAGAGEPLRLRLRRFSSYLRYQRNRYIESLASMGLSAPEIQRRIQADLGESVGHSHISRIAQQFRIKKA